MTIEEYLETLIERMEASDDNRFAEAASNFLKAILAVLPSLDHELTLREMQEFCLSHKEENGDINCNECPFFDAGNPEGDEFSWSLPCCTIEMSAPESWNIPTIKKTIREATP